MVQFVINNMVQAFDIHSYYKEFIKNKGKKIGEEII